MANSNVNVLQTVIQLRRGTEEQWNLVKDSFIPREGEPCVTIQEDGLDVLIKIGDGKRTWGELGYTRDSFVVFFDKTETETEEGTLVTTDTTLEELVLAEENSKILMAFLRGKGPSDFDFLLPLTAFGPSVVFSSNGMTIKLNASNNKWYLTVNNLMETSNKYSGNFDAQNKSIVNLKDSEEWASAVTKQYTDLSTPTFIYLEEQNGVIQSKVTDIEKLRQVLMFQTRGYDLKQNPLYKATKCYAVLDGNCYDLVYNYLEDTQEPGKSSIVKRTFYAITTDGLNKLSVVIDENDNVTWTKETKGVASEQFVVTLTNVEGSDTWESDKTPVEIAASAQAGKQVVLKRMEGKETAYLVSVTDERADFCFIGISTDLDYTPSNSDTFIQEWVTITADKAAKIYREMRTDVLRVQKNGPNWVSTVSPRDFLMAGVFGPASNVYLNLDSTNDDGQLSGVIAVSFNSFHVYFPDYTNNKVYDFKWNEDEENTYTLTELNLGAESSMIVNFTVTDISLTCTADKTFAEVDAAYKKGIPIYGRVALDDQSAFLALSYFSGVGYCFTGIASYGDSTMSIFYSNTKCKATGGVTIWANGFDEDATLEARAYRIANVGSPTEASDAATKGYVDTSLAAKTEPLLITLTDNKPDKGVTDIQKAVADGKQVVLEKINGEKHEIGYLVTIKNEIAIFCFADSANIFGPLFPDSIGKREWVAISAAEQEVKNFIDLAVPSLIIEKNSNDIYTSTLNPNVWRQSMFLNHTFTIPSSGSSNVLLYTNDGIFSGMLADSSGSVELHFYFSDYKNNKLYDLKWNEDENPSTYTFTESVLDEKPMVVTFTITDAGTFALKADTPYADIVEAVNKGRIVYALVPNPGPVFGQLTNASSSTLYFAASNSLGQMMSIRMLSDSDISGNFITTLYRDIYDEGDFDAAGSGIANVKEPVNPSDAATKQYTDDILTAAKSYADNILTAGNSDSVVIKSSTPDSTKKFRITVDDAGTISATEVT